MIAHAYRAPPCCNWRTPTDFPVNHSERHSDYWPVLIQLWPSCMYCENRSKGREHLLARNPIHLLAGPNFGAPQCYSRDLKSLSPHWREESVEHFCSCSKYTTLLSSILNIVEPVDRGFWHVQVRLLELTLSAILSASPMSDPWPH